MSSQEQCSLNANIIMGRYASTNLRQGFGGHGELSSKSDVVLT